MAEMTAVELALNAFEETLIDQGIMPNYDKQDRKKFISAMRTSLRALAEMPPSIKRRVCDGREQ